MEETYRGPAARSGAALPAVAAAIIIALAESHVVVAQELQAGLAAAEITPPVGYRMSGYFYERLATGTASPLRAKALVLRQGDRRAAMVFCDIIGLSPQVSSQARRQAAERTGIPAESILIAATHTHTGPLYFGALRDHLHGQAVAKDGSDPCEKEDYPARLVAGIVKAIADAHAACAPAALSAGKAEQKHLAFNRRYHMADGSAVFNPGPLNPNIVRPAGPTDTDVGIVLLCRPGQRKQEKQPKQDKQEKPVAALVNFAMHLDTVGGTLFGPDYPGFLEQALQEKLGREFMLLFGTGTCGDVNHVDTATRQRRKADEIGAMLAATVTARLPELKPVGAPDLAARRQIVRIPLQRCTEQQVAAARADMPKIGGKELTFLRQVEAYKIMDLQWRGGEAADLEVQAFRLGPDLAVVGLPGEVFVELGLAIKRASPFPTTLVVELCQDDIEYIPTKKAFGEGSYEVVNSRIAPGGGEMLVEAACGLLKALAPRTASTRP